MIVIDASETRNDLRVFINPELLMAEGEAECEEGCLSVPGYYERVTRYTSSAFLRLKMGEALARRRVKPPEGMIRSVSST